MKKIYLSLLLIFLGLITHLIFKDSNKFVGVTLIIVGTCFLIRYILLKINK